MFPPRAAASLPDQRQRGSFHARANQPMVLWLLLLCQRTHGILSTDSPMIDLYRGLYRVEVSGWDKNEAFFVEKSDLEWTENSGKRLVLSHEVPDRAVVFVRLLRAVGADRSHPGSLQSGVPRGDPGRSAAVPPARGPSVRRRWLPRQLALCGAHLWGSSTVPLAVFPCRRESETEQRFEMT